jgi:hypothetical protein
MKQTATSSKKRWLNPRSWGSQFRRHESLGPAAGVFFLRHDTLTHASWSSRPPRAQRQILPFNTTRRNLSGDAAYYIAGYCMDLREMFARKSRRHVTAWVKRLRTNSAVA